MAPPSTPMPTDRLHGQWKLHVSENFEAFVDSINPDYDFSVPGCSNNMDDSRIELIISEKANGEWTIVIQRKGDRHELKFRLGKQFQEINPVSGKSVQSLVTEANGKLTQIQQRIGKDGEDATIVREVDNRGHLVVTLMVGDVTARRIYTKA